MGRPWGKRNEVSRLQKRIHKEVANAVLDADGNNPSEPDAPQNDPTTNNKQTKNSRLVLNEESPPIINAESVEESAMGQQETTGVVIQATAGTATSSSTPQRRQYQERQEPSSPGAFHISPSHSTNTAAAAAAAAAAGETTTMMLRVNSDQQELVHIDEESAFPSATTRRREDQRGSQSSFPTLRAQLVDDIYVSAEPMEVSANGVGGVGDPTMASSAGASSSQEQGNDKVFVNRKWIWIIILLMLLVAVGVGLLIFFIVDRDSSSLVVISGNNDVSQTNGPAATKSPTSNGGGTSTLTPSPAPVASLTFSPITPSPVARTECSGITIVNNGNREEVSPECPDGWTCGYESYSSRRQVCCEEATQVSDRDTTLYCLGLTPLGEECSFFEEGHELCSSGICLDGVCEKVGRDAGDSCLYDGDCATDACGLGDLDDRSLIERCCERSETMEVFRGTHYDTFCVGQVEDGLTCFDDQLDAGNRLCRSGICIHGQCEAEPAPVGKLCQEHADCGGSIPSCALNGLDEETREMVCCANSAWGLPNGDDFEYVCQGIVENGFPCATEGKPVGVNEICKSGMCIQGLCQSTKLQALEVCYENEDCLLGACGLGVSPEAMLDGLSRCCPSGRVHVQAGSGNNYCLDSIANGEDCWTPFVCLSGNCDEDGICSPPE